MFVDFKWIEFKNVMSYGAKTTHIDFKNGISQICGLNGAGKSSLIEALTFNLFGKPYRNIKIEELINRTNKGKLETEVCFECSGETYNIFRSLKPDKLFIKKNGKVLDLLSTKALNQEEIIKILGVDYPMFKQIVSLAVSYNRPFLTMSASEKREIVESIFNIRIFGSMLKRLKVRISDEKVKYQLAAQAVKMLENSVMLLKNQMDEAEKAKARFEADKENDKKYIMSTLEYNESKLALIKNTIRELSDELKRFEESKKVLEDEKSEIEEKIKNFSFEPDRSNLDRLIDKRSKIQVVSGDYAKSNFIIVAEADVEALSEDVDKETVSSKVVISDLMVKIEEIKKTISEKNSTKSTNIKTIGGYNFQIEKNNKSITYLENNENCETCGNSITTEYKVDKIGEIKKEIINLSSEANNLTKINSDIESEISKSQNEIGELHTRIVEIDGGLKMKSSKLLNEINNLKALQVRDKHDFDVLLKINRDEIKDLSDQISREEARLGDEIKRAKSGLDSELTTNKERMGYCLSQIERSRNQINSGNRDEIPAIEKIMAELNEKLLNLESRTFSIEIEPIKKKFDAEAETYAAKYEEYEESGKMLEKYTVVSKILSEDGIKTYFFESLTPILNVKINDYLSRFGLPIKISFDNTMEETITRINEPGSISYLSHSEGEKKCIDISILFSFIEITKIICNWNSNLLMIDELIDGQVDASKIELIVQAVKEFSNNGSVYLITHKMNESLKQYIDSCIEVATTDGFSEMTEI